MLKKIVIGTANFSKNYGITKNHIKNRDLKKKLVCLGWQSAQTELTRITRSDLACSLPSNQSIGGSEQRTAHRPPQSTEAETFSLGGARQR